MTVDAIEYTGASDDAAKIIAWVARHRGLCFSARELQFRHDFGTYWHPEHGFVYLPQGARRPGQVISVLQDNELIVRTDSGIYAVVFPGDYVLRSRSGFYPLASESFHRSYVSNTARRGTIPAELSPAV
jgi:hypothetical protein